MTDGEHIEYYENGEIWFKCNYLGGKLNGEYITYFTSGNISYKENYLDDKKNGEYISYFKNGEITNKCYYIYGIEVSEIYWTSYNRNRKLELLGL